MHHLSVAKINNMLIDNAEDLDAAMTMYNLTECSKNYRKTTSSLWIYYRYELTDVRNNNNFSNKNVINSEPFKYKRSLQELLVTLMKKLPMERVMKLIILLICKQIW